jgi:deoxyribodipyrimidine photo-lyase
MNSPKLIIYWARRDLRLTDNPALTQAIQHSKQDHIPFAPIFILEDYMMKADPSAQFGYPQRIFLAKALPEFISQFEIFHLIQSKAVALFRQLTQRYEIELYVNEDIYPDFTTQITKIQQLSINIHLFPDRLSVNHQAQTQTGKLYSVFTPFKKSVWQEFLNLEPLLQPDLHHIHWADACLNQDITYIQPDHQSIQSIFNASRLMNIQDTIYNLDEYHPKPDLEMWYTHETQAHNVFKGYVQSGLLTEYGNNRDSLELDTMELLHQGISLQGKTSKMSLALAWGLISSRSIKALIQDHYQESFINTLYEKTPYSGVVSYLSELIWREFYGYLLYHYPELLDTEFQPKFRNTIQWVDGDKAHKRFEAWITGTTGYPIVDAAMMQLAKTGWMHNRARMIVASVLTKNLGVDWRWGQEYFRASLIDLDEASNNGGWQWGASVGADPKPIRIFNPYLQAKNYDPDNTYIHTWLGSDYTPPLVPIVDYKLGREQALIRYNLTKVKPRDY